MSLKNFLENLSETQRNQVYEIATDMDSFYINTAKYCFPKAHIVIDHYHVIALALRKLDELRLLIQSTSDIKLPKRILHKHRHKLSEKDKFKLDECLKENPEIRSMWIIIQELRKVYRKKNWKAGDSQFRWVLKLCKDSCLTEANELAKTLKRWRPNILNYYISRTTNAFTEGTHTKFEMIKRQHCGIRNVERFAKRLIFCTLPFHFILQILPDLFK